MTATTYIAVLTLAFLSGLTTLIGVFLAMRFRRCPRGMVMGMGFSAGIMLLVSFMELIPESLGAAGTQGTLTAVLSGMLLIGALNFIIPHTHMVREKGRLDSHMLRVAYLVALGLILHDFPEGFAMANSYIYSPSLGLFIALAIAIHNIPEEFAMAVPIVHIRRTGFLLKAAFLSGLAEPAGAVVGLFAVSFLPGLNPLFMAFAAGAMIFVSIHELIPMAMKYGRPGMLLSGVVMSILVYLALGMAIPE
jgi:ZIP family zinc transporter